MWLYNLSDSENGLGGYKLSTSEQYCLALRIYWYIELVLGTKEKKWFGQYKGPADKLDWKNSDQSKRFMKVGNLRDTSSQKEGTTWANLQQNQKPFQM